MALAESKALHISGYYPRGVADAAPVATAGRAYFPRGESGLTVTPELAAPLSYYSFDTFGAVEFADEMATRAMDRYDQADVSATAKHGGGALYHTSEAWAGGLAGCSGLENTLGRTVDKVLFGFWAKAPSAAGGIDRVWVMGFPYYDLATAEWTVDAQFASSGALPCDGAWHHVAIAAIAGGSVFRRVVDGVLDASWSSSSAGSSVLDVLTVYVYGDAILDELAVCDMPSGVTLADLQTYATALYNSGTGLFYRSGTGWF